MPRPKIDDEFKDMPISRQRKYQMRMRASGQCPKCGLPAELDFQGNAGKFCLKHAVDERERQRRARGGRPRRNLGSKTYRLQRARNKTHFDAGVGKTSCGLDSPSLTLTSDLNAVTCEECFQAWHTPSPNKTKE